MVDGRVMKFYPIHWTKLKLVYVQFYTKSMWILYGRGLAILCQMTGGILTISRSHESVVAGEYLVDFNYSKMLYLKRVADEGVENVALKAYHQN